MDNKAHELSDLSGTENNDQDTNSDDNNGPTTALTSAGLVENGGCRYAYTNGIALENEDPMVSFEFPQISRSSRTREDDMYEDLCYVTLRVGPTSQTSIWPTTNKRECCIKELVETEKNYIDALNMIVRHFSRPLKPVLNSNDRRAIFLHIEELAEIHTGFHSDLFKACASPQGKISTCFLHWKQRFVVYGNYCANLPRAQALVDELCTKNELISRTIEQCQLEANDGKFKLRDLLSLPMQRILKYHLFLNELIKSTDDDHHDRLDLAKAYESMVDLGQYINEVKRDSETLEVISEIQQSITDLDMPENTELKDYGRLVKEGELKMKSNDEDRTKNRYIFLFDKVMLMCKSIRAETYSYKEALILADYRVEDVPATALSSTSKLMQKDKFNHSWMLVHRTAPEKSTYTFYAKSDEVKNKWIEAVRKALDNVCPDVHGLSDHSFTMYTFERPTVCSECEQLLRGIFFQGYKCTVCDFAVHKSCLSTVRSCGAPNLPPRPPYQPSSPFLLSPYASDDSKISWTNDIGKDTSGTSTTNGLTRLRALFPFQGDRTVGQISSFNANDVIYLLKKTPSPAVSPIVETDVNAESFWKGRVERTGEEGLFPASHTIQIEPARQQQTYDESNLPLNLDFTNGSSRLSSPSSASTQTLNLDDHQWFAGSMERDDAQNILARLPTGSYLVRISSKQKGCHAISINYNGQVKHMRILNAGEHCYLSTTKYFRSVIDLVKWYEDHSLAESFNGLNVTLMTPFKQALAANAVEPIGYAMAMYSFIGNASNLLSLRKGDRVAILSKTGEEKGWWKGQVGYRVGYFPMAYVVPEAPSDTISESSANGETDTSPESKRKGPEDVVGVGCNLPILTADSENKENLDSDSGSIIL